MSRTRHAALRISICLLLGTTILMAAATAHAQKKHHLSFGIGQARLFSDELRRDDVGVDFRAPTCMSFSYRSSVTPTFDGTFDMRATWRTQTASDRRITFNNGYWGLGLRWYPVAQFPRPYIHGNAFLEVAEAYTIEDHTGKFDARDTAMGWGLGTGFELPVNGTFSFPVELMYVHGKPADDVSGLMFTVALGLNFGHEL